MFTKTILLLALAGGSFISSTFAHPTNTGEGLIAERATSHTVTYCDRSTPQYCTTIPAIKNDLKCHTFAAPGFSILTFSPGLSCEVYSSFYCTKGRGGFATKGGVESVTGYFDAETNPRAIKNEVALVGSFKCA